MQCCVEHLVIVAGPTASGKSTLIREICERQFPEVGRCLGAENLHEWPWIHTASTAELTEPALKSLILHYDLLSSGEKVLRLSDLLEGTRKVSFVTLWTPPVRLEHQLIAGKLRQPIKDSFFQLTKSTVFRCLPRFLIIRIARLPLWWLPRNPVKYRLNALKIYLQPSQVVQIYRRWFQFCDQHVSKTQSHIIVEFDAKLKFYSRDEWETMVLSYEACP